MHYATLLKNNLQIYTDSGGLLEKYVPAKEKKEMDM